MRDTWWSCCRPVTSWTSRSGATGAPCVRLRTSRNSAGWCSSRWTPGCCASTVGASSPSRGGPSWGRWRRSTGWWTPPSSGGSRASCRRISPCWLRVRGFVDEGGPGRLLAELLEWRADRRPTPIEELTKLMCEGARRAFGGLSPLHLDVVRGWTRDHVDRSARRDRGADPGRGGGGGTPRGHRDHGARPAGPGDRLRRRPGRADRSGRTRAVAAAAAAAWVQRRDGREAARELVAALGEPHRETPVVLAGLGQLEELVGEHSGPAVQTLLGRPRDGLAVHWLMSAGALSARDVEPERLLVSGRGHPRGDPGDRRPRGTRRRVRYR